MSNGEGSYIADSKLTMEAMMSEFQCKMGLEFDSFHERMDQLENSQGRSQGRNNRAKNGASNDEYEEDEGHLRAA